MPDQEPLIMSDDFKNAGDVRWVARSEWMQSVSVYKSANQSLTTAVDTVITFNTEDHDTNLMHDTGSNTGRLVCVVAGVYYIWFNIKWAGNVTGSRITRIRLNGATTVQHNEMGSLPSFNVAQDGGVALRLAVGDYAELFCTQNSGGGLNVVGGQFETKFGMYRVA